MAKNRIYNILNYCTANSFGLLNGLICKVLNLVPRHKEIVSRIIGISNAKPLSITIGILEIAMAIWILSGYKTKLNAIAQIVVIATMNVLEFFLAPDLLLWGKLNSVFAFLLILIIYLNEFYLKKLK